MKPDNRPPKQLTYRIQVQGHLADRWLTWFPGMITVVKVDSDGATTTTLTGTVADQAALRGTLNKLWDLNLSLLTVDRLESDPLQSRPTGKPTQGKEETS